MEDLVTNQLHFITNTGNILNYIRSRQDHGTAPSQFSLNSIKSVPDELKLPLNRRMIEVSALNIDIAALDTAFKETAKQKLIFGRSERLSKTEIKKRIETLRKASSDEPADDYIARAISNYYRCGFFSQYDWCFTHWGTIADVQSVTASTFNPQLTFIEFTTWYTPPSAALRMLADTFPSVRFKLKSRCRADTPWVTEDIFPVTPWGY